MCKHQALDRDQYFQYSEGPFESFRSPLFETSCYTKRDQNGFPAHWKHWQVRRTWQFLGTRVGHGKQSARGKAEKECGLDLAIASNSKKRCASSKLERAATISASVTELGPPNISLTGRGDTESGPDPKEKAKACSRAIRCKKRGISLAWTNETSELRSRKTALRKVVDWGSADSMDYQWIDKSLATHPVAPTEQEMNVHAAEEASLRQMRKALTASTKVRNWSIEVSKTGLK